MSDINRERAIDVIEMMMAEYEESECIATEITMDDECLEALRFARDSLKTDEAYQLLYERTTKEDLAVESEDCIEREYTAKYIEEFANNEYVSEHEAETIYTIAEGVRHIPSVYPKSDSYIKEIDHLHKYITKLETQIIEQESINAVLEDIKSEINQINIVLDKSPSFKDKRTDAEKCADWWEMDKAVVLNIIDKYICGKEKHE